MGIVIIQLQNIFKDRFFFIFLTYNHFDKNFNFIQWFPKLICRVM